MNNLNLRPSNKYIHNVSIMNHELVILKNNSLRIKADGKKRKNTSNLWRMTSARRGVSAAAKRSRYRGVETQHQRVPRLADLPTVIEALACPVTARRANISPCLRAYINEEALRRAALGAAVCECAKCGRGESRRWQPAIRSWNTNSRSHIACNVVIRDVITSSAFAAYAGNATENQRNPSIFHAEGRKESML